MLHACTAVTSLGLAGLGDTCFQPQSSCFAHIVAMTNLIALHVGGFKDDAADARLVRAGAVLQQKEHRQRRVRIRHLHVGVLHR